MSRPTGAADGTPGVVSGVAASSGAGSASLAAFELLASDGSARRGQITTARGTIQTPVFMPVGTRGAVIHLDATDYEYLGLAVVLANTYHLLARPGVEVVESLGGLHKFTGWDGHFLTDSGGFQIMSLGRRPGGGDQHSRRPGGGGASPQDAKSKVDDEGVTFRSTYDGTQMRLTPEGAMDAQRRLGSDIQMALDVCPELPAPAAEIRLATERTHLWAARAAAAMDDARRRGTAGGQALFGICQGGIDPGLRRSSAETLAGIGFDGYGIGGLSVGESRGEMGPALRAATEVLPAEQPRYLMGVGDPARIVDAIAAGVDMFDCVLPSRLGRHGTALTPQGRINIRNARFARDLTPLDPRPGAGEGRPQPGARFSRGYLRHLMSVNEPTASRILTLHNIAFVNDLVADARAAIEAGQFGAFREQVNEVWGLAAAGVGRPVR
ncbi:tRNA guanosine(34) transglycosylase Tgt [Candidatus Poriferisodalis sp.]|uniref:tRNA guanosine(34) transglycosylase Tgt n=1 Tax=Candidatus Poriferisodalis sp. TaxID=3101277 RepID=UPI003B52F73B